jgi:hypothetical protein
MSEADGTSIIKAEIRAAISVSLKYVDKEKW